MERRIAALYGHDPRELETGARVLALRGVHPTVDAAREALVKVLEASVPEKPDRTTPAARLGSQRLPPAGLWRIHLGLERRKRKVRSLALACGARLPDRARYLGHYLGSSRQLDDRNGLGL